MRWEALGGRVVCGVGGCRDRWSPLRRDRAGYAHQEVAQVMEARAAWPDRLGWK